MARGDLVLICASLIVIQLVVVSSEDIDYTTIHDELKKLAGGMRKKCLAEISGVTNEMLVEAEQGEFPDDNNLACYFKCVMEKGGVLKKDGKINFKVLNKMMPPAFKKVGSEMLDECREINGNDNCELAYNFNKCMFNANPVAYFVI
ncbi:PREDICTED: pheromone-binding protein-related protein 6-like [Dinoponera quadriceps]|uniref:Pheromone-binding protein-related protein 6-like n=1 Tax=Dinoponera quadriceps TaxID=609295 RepID=A0A6P3X670_DINQU|nr:PREDICTED: pheromone-binding protein-related protein 6-like [Dinoponera quadriceps]